MSEVSFDSSVPPGEPADRTGTRRGVLAVVLGLVLAGLAGLLARFGGSGEVSSNSVILPDGSTFKLDGVALDKGYSYQYKSGPAWARRFAPVIPDFIESKFLRMGSGGFSFGGNETNLILITLLEKASARSKLRPERLRISDDRGNVFDSNRGANSFSMNLSLVNGWQVPAFPRRAAALKAQFLGRDSQKRWVELASFTIQNPAIGEGDQWNPEPLPASRTNGNVTVELARFESGVVGSDVDALDPLSPRFTRLNFSFLEDGRSVDHWNVQEITVSDAPGNRWQPHLDLLGQTGDSWARGGQVQFLGALWPEEPAWRIEASAYRTAEFKPERVWDVDRVPFPEAGRHIDLTNRFSIGETTLQLANLVAPTVEITNEWQWIVRYWGNKPSVYSMGIHALEGVGNHRLVLLGAWNEEGDKVELVEHRGWDQSRQALFFKAPQASRSLRLKFGVSEVTRAVFLARPDLRSSAGESQENESR